MKTKTKELNRILTKKFLIQKYTKQKLTIAQISKETNFNVTSITSRIRKYKVKKPNCKIIKKCIDCGKEFESYKLSNRKFCSLSCGRQGKYNSFWNKRHSGKSKKQQKEAKLGNKNANYKKGRYKNRQGYIVLTLPFHPHRSKHNLVLEHRYVMEQKLGRYLKPEEIVHHINGIKDDNRPKNLLLFKNNAEHHKFHYAVYNYIIKFHGVKEMIKYHRLFKRKKEK